MCNDNRLWRHCYNGRYIEHDFSFDGWRSHNDSNYLLSDSSWRLCEIQSLEAAFAAIVPLNFGLGRGVQSLQGVALRWHFCVSMAL